MSTGFAAFCQAEIQEFTRARLPRSPDGRDGQTRLSVILPSYNQAAYIERTLNSIANQHYRPIELIVLDGGSTDGSQAIIERYRDILSHYESAKDGGQAEAINKGFAMATGDFVAWQNSDDLYLPGFFHALDADIRAYPQTDLVIANSYVVGPSEEILWPTRYGPFSLAYLARVGWNLTSQSVFVRRDLASRVGPLPNYNVCFDYEWFLKVARESKSILEMKRYCGAYRIHPESKLSTEGLAMREELDKRILLGMGYSVDMGRSLEEQWRLRRMILRSVRQIHEKILYPNRRLALPAAKAWAAALRLLGHRLSGY